MTVDIKELVKTTKELKLLYVEDDKSAREATLRLLGSFFNDIVTAEDGLDAINKLSENDFDLVISDINMPKLSGLEMLEKIRENKDETPVILLSAHNEAKYFTHAIRLGVEYFILKPIEQEQFIDSINKVVKNINIKDQNRHYRNFLEDEISIQYKRTRVQTAL